MTASQVQLIMPNHVNDCERLFGGQLMAWIDVVSAVAARRHTRTQVITACVDQLDFLAPAYLGDLVRIDTHVSWTGKKSLEVIAESFVESLEQKGDTLINRAYVVFVALDKDGNTCEVPPFVPQTPAQKLEWEQADIRNARRKALRRD